MADEKPETIDQLVFAGCGFGNCCDGDNTCVAGGSTCPTLGGTCSSGSCGSCGARLQGCCAGNWCTEHGLSCQGGTCNYDGTDANAHGCPSNNVCP